MSKKLAIRLQRGAPIHLPCATKLILFLKNCTPPIDLAHFRSKIITNGDGGGGDGDDGDGDGRRIQGFRHLKEVRQEGPVQPCAASPRQGCSRRSLWCSTVVVLFRCRVVLVRLVHRSGRKAHIALNVSQAVCIGVVSITKLKPQNPQQKQDDKSTQAICMAGVSGI